MRVEAVMAFWISKILAIVQLYAAARPDRPKGGDRTVLGHILYHHSVALIVWPPSEAPPRAKARASPGLALPPRVGSCPAPCLLMLSLWR